MRANPSSLEETGSLSRPGLTTPASIKKPALSLISELLTGAQVDESNTELAYRTQLWIATLLLRRTAVCGPACTVVWGPDGATRPATRLGNHAQRYRPYSSSNNASHQAKKLLSQVESARARKSPKAIFTGK